LLLQRSTGDVVPNILVSPLCVFASTWTQQQPGRGVYAGIFHTAAGKAGPEKLFERSWALTVLERTMVRLQDKSGSTKKRKTFDHLKVYLAAEKDSITYREVADKLKNDRRRSQSGIDLLILIDYYLRGPVRIRKYDIFDVLSRLSRFSESTDQRRTR